MSRYFITAAGTDIGKTYVSCSLAHQWHAAGKSLQVQKPVISGWDKKDNDAKAMIEAAGQAYDDAAIAKAVRYRFFAPLSPDIAAARENQTIDYASLLSFCASDGSDVQLIEGVGGTMVPLDDAHTVRDWIADLQIPAILVMGCYLGCISHTLTAVESLRAKNIPIALVILNEPGEPAIDPEETLASMKKFITEPIIRLPYNAGNASDGWKNAPNLVDLL